MLPKLLAVRREGREDTLGELNKDVAGLRIDGRAGSRVAEVNGVRKKIRLPMLPQHFAGIRVVAAHRLQKVRPFGKESVDGQVAIGDHGRAFTREIGCP